MDMAILLTAFRHLEGRAVRTTHIPGTDTFRQALCAAYGAGVHMHWSRIAVLDTHFGVRIGH